MSMFSLEGKIALVTGAGRGIGRGIAEGLASQGATVICASRTRPELDAAVSAIEAGGGSAMALTMDMAEMDSIDAGVQGVIDAYGRIDILFNNAGAMVLGESIQNIDPERWEQLMRVNVTGPYLFSRAVLPAMMEQRRGSIINIGSRMATDPLQGGGVLYSASKAAVHMFSLCLAEEVKEYNIAVNILSPGGLRSEGSAAIPWTQRDWHERVEPSEVGPSAVFLALQDATTFTGQVALRADFGKTWGI